MDGTGTSKTRRLAAMNRAFDEMQRRTAAAPKPKAPSDPPEPKSAPGDRPGKLTLADLGRVWRAKGVADG
jgi:hypothetical protein